MQGRRYCQIVDPPHLVTRQAPPSAALANSERCRWESAITTGRVMSDILHELISEDELDVLIDEMLADAGVDREQRRVCVRSLYVVT